MADFFAQLKGYFNKPGSLALAVLLGLVVIVGGALLLLRDDPETPPAAGSSTPAATTAATTTTTATTTPPVACTDATDFRSYAIEFGVRNVDRVCWEQSGALRAESGLAADAEPGSPPLQALCQALSQFVTGSGHDFKGLTVYSTNTLSPGQPIMTATEPGRCHRP
jgi:hypothetical protein